MPDTTPANMIHRLETLIDLGFDDSDLTSDRDAIDVECSQCDARVINGIAAHERGCPNARHECHGCDRLIPVNVRYCEDC